MNKNSKSYLIEKLFDPFDLTNAIFAPLIDQINR